MYYRIRWDNLWTDPVDMPDDLLEALARKTNVTLRVPPPVEWRFNKEMMLALADRRGVPVAVEASLILIEFVNKP